jgi:hypothetical protein
MLLFNKCILGECKDLILGLSRRKRERLRAEKVVLLKTWEGNTNNKNVDYMNERD